jgi:recombination-promoting nuclease RpnB
LLAFRFLQYNVALIAEHLAQNKRGKKRQYLPTILNLCIYTGKKTPYPHALDIYDCFADPILARAEMFKPLSLIDLGQIEDDELAKNGTADLLEMLLMRSGGRMYLTSCIHYMLSMEEKHSAEELIQAIVNTVPQRKGDIMTAAQQLEQKVCKLRVWR